MKDVGEQEHSSFSARGGALATDPMRSAAAVGVPATDKARKSRAVKLYIILRYDDDSKGEELRRLIHNMRSTLNNNGRGCNGVRVLVRTEPQGKETRTCFFSICVKRSIGSSIVPTSTVSSFFRLVIMGGGG